MRPSRIYSAMRTGLPPSAAAGFATLIGAVFAAVLATAGAERAAAQAPAGILEPGNAAVTGFSGVVRPAQTASGVDPADQTSIDLDGPSARIVDLRRMGGPPLAQLVGAPKPFTFTAGQIGQVFAVALDNAVPPNIYVAASSAYGLPIIVPGQNNSAVRAKKGAPSAVFMPGLWGPQASGGGPGSIWKIDGTSGNVSLFVNVALGGAPNAGPALGGLAYDPASNSLFVADRQTGMIHRYAASGAELGHYDHGVDGRIAQGLQPVPYDPSQPLDITSPQFDSQNPATWRYAPPERRVFGLGIRAGRLYYAVAAGLQIWSIGINPDGSFGNDAAIEINVPPAASPTEISKITFDDQGRMLLAERPAPTGAYDFEALTQESIGRALRYALTDINADGSRVWQSEPDEYAIGFPHDLRNDNGGIAVGYDYDNDGLIDSARCGGFVWSTGEQLRKATDPALVARLSVSGPLNVDGLQGNYIWDVRPANVPPLTSYFIDYDDRFDDDAARGHMGDIAIWRACGPVVPGGGGWMLPDGLFGWNDFGVPLPFGNPQPPNFSCPADQKKPGFHCCPKGSSPAGGQCKPWCPNGAKDQKSIELCGLGFDPTTFDPNNLGKLRCLGGSKPIAGKGEVACAPHSPVLNEAVCPAGYAKQNVAGVGSVCLPTKQQLNCGPGKQISGIDGKCHELCGGGLAWPVQHCCPAGSVLSVAGKCCPPGSHPDPKSGACHAPTKPSCKPGEPGCPPGGQQQKEGCKPGEPGCPSGGQQHKEGCKPGEPNCPAGGQQQKEGCKPGEPSCPSGGQQQKEGCKPGEPSCPSGGQQQKDGCTPGTPGCTPGGTLTGQQGKTTPGSTPGSGPGSGTAVPGSCKMGPQGQCCGDGYQPVKDGSCCLVANLTSSGVCCPQGQQAGGTNNSQCVSSSASNNAPPFGTIPNTSSSGGGMCCANGLIPTVSGICCSPSQATSLGLCCPAGQKPQPDGHCKPGTTVMPKIQCGNNQTVVNGNCCNSSQVYQDTSGHTACCGNNQTAVNGACCNSSQVYQDTGGHTACCQQALSAAGECVVLREEKICKAGFTRLPDGSCCPTPLVSADGKTCHRPGPEQTPNVQACGAGFTPMPNGSCCPSPLVSADGRTCRRPDGATTSPEQGSCGPGFTQLPDGSCCPAPLVSADGRSCRRPQIPPPQQPQIQQPQIEQPQIQQPQGQPPEYQRPGFQRPERPQRPGFQRPERPQRPGLRPQRPQRPAIIRPQRPQRVFRPSTFRPQLRPSRPAPRRSRR
jgi:hypothetical protein